MRVHVRLFATLRDYLPAGARTGTTLELPEGASISDALQELGIPSVKAALVLLDGHHAGDRSRRLHDGCVLSVWPHVGGG